MYRYLQSNPPAAGVDVGAQGFSTEAVAQALTASVLNLIVNGVNVYLASKISGK